ncbi:MAG: hypothetical protein ACOC9E_00865 [Chloroflexota bacterium]
MQQANSNMVSAVVGDRVAADRESAGLPAGPWGATRGDRGKRSQCDRTALMPPPGAA